MSNGLFICLLVHKAAGIRPNRAVISAVVNILHLPEKLSRRVADPIHVDNVNQVLARQPREHC